MALGQVNKINIESLPGAGFAPVALGAAYSLAAELRVDRPDDETSKILAFLEREDCANARCLRLMAYTGCDSSEARLARWENFDAEARTLTVVAFGARAGARRVGLSAQAVGMLSAIDRGSEWIFPSKGNLSRPLSKQTLSLYRKAVEHRLGLRGLTYRRISAICAQPGEAAGAIAGGQTLEMLGGIGGLDALKLELPCALTATDNEFFDSFSILESKNGNQDLSLQKHGNRIETLGQVTEQKVATCATK